MTAAPHVLVTDAHATSALSVVRSLGARGMRVTVAGEERRFNLAAHSRYVERVVVWPGAAEAPEAYLGQLQAELRARRYDLLLPLTDTTVTLVRHARQSLDSLVRVALPSNAALEAAQDKALTVRMAAESGVRTPRTWTFASHAELEAMAPGLPYPCVIKPRFSCQWEGHGPLRRGTVSYADSAAALVEKVSRSPLPPDAFLVQEFVRGSGVGVFALTDEGAPLATFAHRRLREANPTGGRASLAQSIAPDARLLAPALRLLARLRWTGVAMIEFKDPGAPGEPALMEVNGRFWGSLPLAIASGVDFPFLLAQLLLGEPVAPDGGYRVNVRCRHLKGDLSYLAAALKGRPAHWTGPYPTRLGALAAVAPWPGRWSSYNFRLDDPMPALREAADFVAGEVSRLRPGRLRPAAETR